MYKIKAGDSLIYDSTNKYDYPCTEPVLNLELGEAGNLEFTLLPGHPMHDAIEEMQTFVSAYQDDDLLFDGRVLQAEEDTFGQVRCTCEGALTFLLDSEMEPNTYTETMAEFFARCINEHNKQVESRKQFSVGNVSHDEADTKLEFKLEGYNQTREVLNNLLISKHGGFLQVRYENGQRYLDYIQYYTKTTNQPIKIGYNVIDKTKHVSGENLFTILRPLGKNNLTIEGASSENLLEEKAITNGKFLAEGGGDRIYYEDGMFHSSVLISVTPGKRYLYGPGDMYVACYNEEKVCMTTLEPDGTYSVTIPTEVEGWEDPIKFVRLSYHKEFDSKITFIEDDGLTSLIDGAGGLTGKMLGYADHGIDPIDTSEGVGGSGYDIEYYRIEREREEQTPGWSYNPTYIPVTSGSSYLAIPGSISVNYYRFIDTELKPVAMYKPTDDLGCDVFTVPSDVSHMRISYPNRFGSAMKVIPGANMLASRGTGLEGKVSYHPKDKEEEDPAWCYSDFIKIDEDTYYTGGPSPIKVCFYDENDHYISFAEANREGLTMHYVKSPHGAKFAKVSFLAEYKDEQQFQKGKALILTKLDKGTKTILLPERIAKYGQIIHSETFSEITDAQELYNAAIEWVSLHHSMLPASLDYGIVDFHLLNPDIEMFELGDVYDNIEGFEDETLTVGSLSKNMENPANDTLTLKNLAELMGPDAGKSSGSLSSKYAANGNSGSGGSGGSGSGGSSAEEEEEAIPDEILIKALKSIGIEAPRIRLLAEERDGLKAQIDIIARGKEGNESRITLTDTAVAVNSENIIHLAKNIYNIADNVVTIADTVFTHANLIWNEAKDIVTIADNMYILTDNLTIVADKISIIANDIDILAKNIRITADRIEIKAREIETTVSERFTVMAGRVDTLENGAKAIFGSALNITPAQAALANGILYLDENGILHIKYGSGIRFDGPNQTDYGVYLNDMLEAGALIQRIENTAGQTLEAKFGTYTAGVLDAGVFVNRMIDDTGTSYAANFGTYVNSKLDAGVMVTKITGDTSNTSYDVKLGTYVNGKIDAGTVVSKITGDNGNTAYDVKLGTYINGKIDAGTIVSKITGDNGNADYSVKLGTYVKGQIDGGLIVDKVNDLKTGTTEQRTKFGTFQDGILDGGIMANKLVTRDSNGNIVSTEWGEKFGTYVNGQLDAGVIVTKITGNTGNDSVAVKLGTFVNEQLTGGMIVEKLNDNSTTTKILGSRVNIQASDLATWGVYTDNTLTAGVIAEKLTGKAQGSKTALTLLGDEIDLEGNTTIKGLLTVKNIIADGVVSKQYILKNDVKFGTAASNVSLGDSFTSVSKSTSGDEITLMFTRAGGGSPATVTFNKATAGSLRLAGGGSNMFTAELYKSASGSQTVLDSIGGSISFSSTTFTKSTTVNVKQTTFGSGTVAFLSLSDYWDAAQNAVVQRSVNSPTNTILLARTDHGGAKSKSLTITYNTSPATSQTITVPINADLVYQEGVDSVTQRTIKSIDDVTLGASHTSSKDVTLSGTYSDDEPFTWTIRINTAALTLAAMDAGWEDARAKIQVDGNKISGPTAGYGNAGTLYTVTADTEIAQNITNTAPGYYHASVRGYAKINDDYVDTKLQTLSQYFSGQA